MLTEQEKMCQILKAQVADSGYLNFSYYFTTQDDLDIQWVMDSLSPKMTLNVQSQPTGE